MTLGSLFDGAYLISDSGELYSIRTGRWLRPATDRYGYLVYTISIHRVRKTLKAHRLVAEAFLPNPENKPTVDHINGDRTDNRLENLRWATLSEQQTNPVTVRKAERVHAITDYRQMAAKKNFGRKRVSVTTSGDLIGVYESATAAGQAVGVSTSKVCAVCNGHRRKAGGYQFCYV